jgi:hypothetical protein
MREAEQPFAPGPDEIAVPVEDHDRMCVVAIEAVDPVFGIDRDRARLHLQPLRRTLPVFVHLVGVFALADDRIHGVPLYQLCCLSSGGGCRTAIAFDMKDPRRGVAEDRAPFGRGQRGGLDHAARIEIADAERVVGPEHDPVGADHVA